MLLFGQWLHWLSVKNGCGQCLKVTRNPEPELAWLKPKLMKWRTLTASVWINCRAGWKVVWVDSTATFWTTVPITLIKAEIIKLRLVLYKPVASNIASKQSSDVYWIWKGHFLHKLKHLVIIQYSASLHKKRQCAVLCSGRKEGISWERLPNKASIWPAACEGKVKACGTSHSALCQVTFDARLCGSISISSIIKPRDSINNSVNKNIVITAASELCSNYCKNSTQRIIHNLEGCSVEIGRIIP